MGVTILDYYVGFPQWPVYGNLTIDIEAVAIGGFTALDLYIPASPAGSLPADGNKGKNAEGKDECVSNEGFPPEFHWPSVAWKPNQCNRRVFWSDISIRVQNG